MSVGEIVAVAWFAAVVVLGVFAAGFNFVGAIQAHRENRRITRGFAELYDKWTAKRKEPKP